MAAKRKHSVSKEESKAATDRIIQLENNVLNSQQNLNDIVEILGLAKGANVESAFVAINSLSRIFSALWRKGLLKRSKEQDSSAANTVNEWLRGNYNDYIGVLKAVLKRDEAPMQVAALKLLLQTL
ncbi:Maturation and nuclear export of 40S ribosomal subunits interacting protein, partial [Coemansia sp. RSA 2320]